MGERVSDTEGCILGGRLPGAQNLKAAGLGESRTAMAGLCLLSQGEDGPPGNGTEGFPGFPVSTQSPA